MYYHVKYLFIHLSLLVYYYNPNFLSINTHTYIYHSIIILISTYHLYLIIMPSIYTVNIIQTIALFSEAHPPFVTRHLTILLPYLKGDISYSKEENSTLKLNIINILSYAAVLDNSSYRHVYNDVGRDLTEIVMKENLIITKAAINCLTLIAENIFLNARILYNLANTCFHSIKSALQYFKQFNITTSNTTINNNNTTTNNNNNNNNNNNQGNSSSSYNTSVGSNIISIISSHSSRLQRCLIIYGYICEYIRKCPNALENLINEFKSNDKMNSCFLDLQSSSSSSAQANIIIASRSILDIESLPPMALQGVCYAAAVYSLSLQSSSPLSSSSSSPSSSSIPPSAAASSLPLQLRENICSQVQARAVQALCGAFTGHPRLILLAQDTHLLSKLFSGVFDSIIHERFVIAFKDMMIAEEVRMMMYSIL